MTASRSLLLNMTGHVAEEMLLYTDGVVIPTNAARKLITSMS